MSTTRKFKVGDIVTCVDSWSIDYKQPSIITSLGKDSYFFAEGLDLSFKRVESSYILWDSPEALWLRL